MSEKTIDPNLLGEKIVKELKQVFDPEIPVDVYELGLIYDVFIKIQLRDQKIEYNKCFKNKFDLK